MNQHAEMDFWSKVDKLGDVWEGMSTPCWDWLGYLKSNGYGSSSLRLLSQETLVHRISYEIHYGVIPAGLEIDHLCHNKRCVNPEHFEAVTPSINTVRSYDYNGRRVCCQRGHLFDDHNSIWEYGHRHCRTCRNMGQRERYQARRLIKAIKGGK